jgi:hypothetical protein
VEFRLLVDGVREYHQVKRQRGGNWTLSALNGEAVLANFFEKLSDPEAAASSNPPTALRT